MQNRRLQELCVFYGFMKKIYGTQVSFSVFRLQHSFIMITLLFISEKIHIAIETKEKRK